MKRLTLTGLGWLLVSLANGSGVAPAFSVANTIQSKMVIQQGKSFSIWGHGTAGREIEVRADWMRASRKVTCDGKNNWITAIMAPNAEPGKYIPHTIKLISSRDTIVLSDILIGEVWVCGGQSNMDMTIRPFLPWLKGALNFEKEIADANYPAIRLFDVRTDFKATPQDDCQGQWKVCSPLTAGDFSAVAYFYARELWDKLRVPVGLVVSSVGGSSCQAWTSRRTLNSDPLLKTEYLYPYDTSTRSKEKLDSGVTFEKVVRPTLFYNAMIYPLRHLSVRGFIWYQGESNKDDKGMYTRLCGAMIRNWRELFGDEELPFYYVQVAPYTWEKNDPTEWNYALLREAQGVIRDSVKHTGMAVIMDISEPDDIHPRNKQGVGLRLAKIALVQTYGRKNISCLGPQFAGIRIEGRMAKISFRPGTIGSGLTTLDGAAPKNFYISGPDHVFHYAEARIVDTQVWLQSDDVMEPVAVRYAFTNYPVANFGNMDGLPAEPFRSDNWEKTAREPVKAHEVLRAEPAPEWAEMLKQDSGWIGADGIYCVPLDGVEAPGQGKNKETLFWFSDDIWGKVSGDTLEGNWEMAHNGVAIMKGDEPGKGKMQFYKRQDKDGHVLAAFEPQTKNALPGDYYWLGDGFFNHALDSTIYLFGYRIRNIPDGGIYPFEDVGVSLIAIPKGSKPPYTDQRQVDAPLFVADSKGRGKVVFGSNVLANTVGARAPRPDGYIYVYGVRGKLKELLVARVPDVKFEDFSAWRFWDGKDWQPDIDKCAALTERVSNEMSVSFMEDGRVIAVYQLDTNSPDIMVQVAKTPEGPFQLAKKVGSTPEIYEDIDFYTYNAKAHPHLSKPGELLISYNVNSFDFADDIIHHPHHLRPRFITIKYR